MTKLRTILVLLAALGVVATTTNAAAQERTRTVVPLLTETVRLADAQPQTGYWWQTPTSPSWTKTDKMLLERLAGANIEFFTPSGETRISKIYRRPNLSLANASRSRS